MIKNLLRAAGLISDAPDPTNAEQFGYIMIAIVLIMLGTLLVFWSMWRHWRRPAFANSFWTSVQNGWFYFKMTIGSLMVFLGVSSILWSFYL